MAMTLTDVARPTPAGPGQELRIYEVTLDTDYAAGGYELDADLLGVTEIVTAYATVTAGFIPAWDKATEALFVYYGNYDAADGPLIEVADVLDAIAGLTTRVLAVVRP